MLSINRGQWMGRIVIIFWLTTLSASAAAQFAVEGVFGGTMTLYAAPERPIPLSVSLALTGEEEVIDGEERKVIDGSLLVDDEGGPYMFAKVTFEIEELRFDMRYNRPELNFGTTIPSSFRLVGNLHQDGGIRGKVLSGVAGRIGTFRIRRLDDRDHLVAQTKYIGVWSGLARTAGGSRVPMRIVLEDSFGNTKNPSRFEFDFTPGKVGHIRWNRIRLGVDRVAIDYLRRRVVLYHHDGGGPGLAVEFEVDMDTGVIEGRVNSTGRGTTAVFRLPPQYFPALAIDERPARGAGSVRGSSLGVGE